MVSLLGECLLFINDIKFIHSSHSHVTPEAFDGGPIALVHNDDKITIDANTRQMTLHIPDEELAARKKNWQPKPPKYTKGVLAKYIKTVKSASEGAVTDEF